MTHVRNAMWTDRENGRQTGGGFGYLLGHCSHLCSIPLEIYQSTSFSSCSDIWSFLWPSRDCCLRLWMVSFLNGWKLEKIVKSAKTTEINCFLNCRANDFTRELCWNFVIICEQFTYKFSRFFQHGIRNFPICYTTVST